MNQSDCLVTLRRHDLDALRAFVMFLGIVLHSALSFTGFPWLVEDRSSNPVFQLLFCAIHGFRMPLFFLLSGLFTMMLWRRRGVVALLKQRTLRIFIPFILGLVTLIPALHWASSTARDWSSQHKGISNTTEPGWLQLLKASDWRNIKVLLENGADSQEVDIKFGIPMLGWACLYGNDSPHKRSRHVLNLRRYHRVARFRYVNINVRFGFENRSLVTIPQKPDLCSYSICSRISVIFGDTEINV